jgi:small nuclear ribonucleoprotein
MANGIDRPLDLLNISKGKEILVQLKSGKQMVGTLRAFDIHVNVVLDNAKEVENGQQTRKYGLAFLRGDAIVFISPSPQ